MLTDFMAELMKHYIDFDINRLVSYDVITSYNHWPSTHMWVREIFIIPETHNQSR